MLLSGVWIGSMFAPVSLWVSGVSSSAWIGPVLLSRSAFRFESPFSSEWVVGVNAVAVGSRWSLSVLSYSFSSPPSYLLLMSYCFHPFFLFFRFQIQGVRYSQQSRRRVRVSRSVESHVASGSNWSLA